MTEYFLELKEVGGGLMKVFTEAQRLAMLNTPQPPPTASMYYESWQIPPGRGEIRNQLSGRRGMRLTGKHL